MLRSMRNAHYRRISVQIMNIKTAAVLSTIILATLACAQEKPEDPLPAAPGGKS
jgi:hypothetical protein